MTKEIMTWGEFNNRYGSEIQKYDSFAQNSEQVWGDFQKRVVQHVRNKNFS